MNINRMMAAFAAITLTAVAAKGQTTYLGPALPITNITANAGLVTLNWDDYTGITGFKLYSTESLDPGLVDWQPMTDAQTGLIRINPGEPGDHVFALGDTAVTFTGIGDKRFYRLVAVKGGTPPNDPGYPPYTPDPSVTWSGVDHTLKIDLTTFAVTKLAPNFDVRTDPDGKTTNLYLRYIKSGTFTMGAPSNEYGCQATAAQTTVTFSSGFYIGVYELTEAQYNCVMGSGATTSAKPQTNLPGYGLRGTSVLPPDTPPQSASFMGKLRTEVPGLAFDLPTEAQWEYACRASSSNTSTVPDENTTNVGKGTIATTQSDLEVRLDAIAWWEGNYSLSGGKQDVGLKIANSAGLYDMIGNVIEWCLDAWDYSTPLLGGTDPLGTIGSGRIQRGGAFSATPQSFTSNNVEYSAAFRNYNSPGIATGMWGFRVCAFGAVYQP